MSSTTNYYEELSLSAEMSVEEINSKLDQLENTWNQRMLRDPEKAHAILSVIEEARTVFSTAQSKADYDNSFNPCSNDPVHSDGSVFSKWYDTAVSYYESREYDMAKAALEKALVATDNPEGRDDSFLSYAADICRFNKEYDRAMSFINEAILMHPDNWNHYLLKSAIFADQKNYAKAIGEANKALGVANTREDQTGQGWANGFLSRLFYLNGDRYQAYSAAMAANELGDPSEQGGKVLSLLDEPRYLTDDEENQYRDEKNAYESKIKGLLKQIIDSHIIPESEHGWLLWTEIHQSFEDPALTVLIEESINEYYLTESGKYISVNKGFGSSPAPVIPFSEAMPGEFSDRIIRNLDMQTVSESIGAFGFSRTRYFPYNISPDKQIPLHIAEGETDARVITTHSQSTGEFTQDTYRCAQRITRLKGLGFYNRLQSIWDQYQAAYTNTYYEEPSPRSDSGMTLNAKEIIAEKNINPRLKSVIDSLLILTESYDGSNGYGGIKTEYAFARGDHNCMIPLCEGRLNEAVFECKDVSVIRPGRNSLLLVDKSGTVRVLSDQAASEKVAIRDEEVRFILNLRGVKDIFYRLSSTGIDSIYVLYTNGTVNSYYYLPEEDRVKENNVVHHGIRAIDRAIESGDSYSICYSANGACYEGGTKIFSNTVKAVYLGLYDWMKGGYIPDSSHIFAGLDKRGIVTIAKHAHQPKYRTDETLWDNIKDITAILTYKNFQLYGLKKDGTVICAHNELVGTWSPETIKLAGWTDVTEIAVSTATPWRAGLTVNGEVLLFNMATQEAFNLSETEREWNSIILIRMQIGRLYGVKTDGSVLIEQIDSRTGADAFTYKGAIKCWDDLAGMIEESKERLQEEDKEQQRQMWISQNRCRHCGGAFKGLFTKKCSDCGQVKDY